MSKTVPKPVTIEVTHLYSSHDNKLLTQTDLKYIESKVSANAPNEEPNDNRCLVDAVARKLSRRLGDCDDNLVVESDDNNRSLISIPFKKSATLRNYYEERQLFRFSGSVRYVNPKRDMVKKSWTKLCDSQHFANTLVMPNMECLKQLADIDRLIPRQQYHKIESFSLGSIVDLSHFVKHYSSTTSSRLKGQMNVAKDDIMADFQHDQNRLYLKFRVSSGGLNGKYTKNIRYKCEYNFKAFTSAVVSFATVDNKKVMRIYFSLTHPPILFKVFIDDLDYDEELRDKKRKDRLQRRGQPVFTSIESKGVHNNEVQSYYAWIRDNHFHGCDAETIGKSNVLMLEIPIIVDPKKLRDKYREPPDPYRILYLMRRFARIPIYFSHIKTHESFDKNLVNERNKCKIKYPFPIEYAFLSMFSNSFQTSDELFFKNQSKIFIEKVTEFAKIDEKATEDTLFELAALIDRKAIFCTINALEEVFKNYKKINDKTQNINIETSFNVEIESIRRCILTPTRFLILPPQPTLRSRFIVDNDSNYTIRLSVREDDLESLQFTVRTNSDTQKRFLKEIVKERIMKGIPIGDRVYEFLGSSSSQLRDAGMILYAKDIENRTAESIRENIGDFRETEIRRNPAKYVARLGLAFSQVMTHIEVKKSETLNIDDIVSENMKLDEHGDELHEPYVFSDGIGKVSQEIMKRVYEKLPNECRYYKPCAMQIRYGGVKGMVCFDPTLNGSQILFRKSMVKYKSNSEQLGIIKLSAPRPLYLNRPMITILEQLGVESRVFQKMLMEDLKMLSNSMVCECSATKLLQNSSTLGIPYRKLYKSGIPFLSEPIFRQIVDSVINHRIYELKLKARIRVPWNCGRTVFGVLDETGTLEYGQVFVKLSVVDKDNMPTDETFILNDEIMVTKFPCLHPGDVRKFTAVDVPALRHIKDCIVFPQKGKRPHPDEMAGSDLDGDEYAVIWEPNKEEPLELIFKRSNEKPMIFPTSNAMHLDHDAEVEDILDFYCNYIVGNNIGLLASAHLAKADFLEKGIYDEICMKLANKYAIALDFAKTGRVENIEWNERPTIYPDFMQKFSTKRSYLSKRILGQLYRHCDRYSWALYSDKNMEITAKPNEHLKVKGWEKYKESAINAYNDYKRKIELLLNQFGVESEATLLSGAFSKTTKYMTGRTETNDVHELLENMINKLFIEFKSRFNDECKLEDTTQTDGEELKERRQRASAWYMIPFELEGDLSDRYFGFSWTITDEICKLMRNCDKFNVNKADHKCVELATQLIDDYFEHNFLYREPVVDHLTNESDKRQLIMKARCYTAEVVLKAWLERQDHLFFKRKIGRKLISSKDAVISDMDIKLRRKLVENRNKLMTEANDILDKPLKTAGELVMNFLKDSMNEWLDIKTIDLSNRVVDTPLVKIGFSALITLNHFFKSREIWHIVKVGPKFTISLPAPIRDDTFYIPLPRINSTRTGADLLNNESSERQMKRNETFKQYVEYMVLYPEQFIERLKQMSGAIEVCLEAYPLTTPRLEHFYLLTATGSVWSLQAVKNFICHPSFFSEVSNRDRLWRRRNLFYRGLQNTQTLQTLGSIDR